MIDVSVVLPVYNAGEYLEDCLSSLLGQELGGLTMEIIAVDDGSTDGSGDVLDEYAKQAAALSVVHQPNSGGPGAPRNVGLERARGRYVFFCDADDYLGRQSLCKMVAFADEHGSDLVIPKLVGINGRWIRKSIYRETQIDADLLRASQSSGPTKLFRRSVIESHSLRFPEGKVIAEDTIFLFRMFTVAGRVSILADDDYYFVRLRDDQRHNSLKPTDPYGYADSLMTAMGAIENALANRAIERALTLELFRRVGLNKYTDGYARADPKRQRMWVEAHQKVIERFLPPGSELALVAPFRQRLALVREGRVEDLVVLATVPSKPKVLAAARRVTSTARGIGLQGTVRMQSHFRRFRSIDVELVSRGSGRVLTYRSDPGRLWAEPGQSKFAPAYENFSVGLDLCLLDALPEDIWDVYVVAGVDGTESRGRLQVAPSVRMTALHRKDRRIAPYITQNNNLSLRIQSRTAGAGTRSLASRALRKAKRTLVRVWPAKRDRQTGRRHQSD